MQRIKATFTNPSLLKVPGPLTISIVRADIFSIAVFSQCHNHFHRSITVSSRASSRAQNLLQVLSTVLERSFVVVQLLLEVGDLGRGLRTLTSETLVDGADGDVDEPISQVLAPLP